MRTSAILLREYCSRRRCADKRVLSVDPAAELLSQLNDIELPDSTGFGIAPGWFLLALCMAVVGWFFWRSRKRRRQSSSLTDWRPLAQSELMQIRQNIHQGQYSNVLPDCSRLARRVALAVMPRSDVAALSGDNWLRTLDQIAGSRVFTQGEGRILATGPYQNNVVADPRQLESLVLTIEQLLVAAGQNCAQPGARAPVQS